MNRAFLIISSAIALAGCMEETVMTGGTPQTATTEELCKIVHWKGNGFDYGADAALTELTRRGEFTLRELDGIRNGLPRIGDSEKAALCGQGFFYDDVNTTTTASGTRKQYAFRDNGLFVYTEQGVVSAIQT